MNARQPSTSRLGEAGMVIVGLLCGFFLGCSEAPPPGNFWEGTGGLTNANQAPPTDGGSPPAPPGSWAPATIVPARPLSGGTLAVAPDGSHAIAADTSGSQVFAVDLGQALQADPAAQGVTRVRFAEDAPGPVAASLTHGFVLLQDSGDLAALPWAAPERVNRAHVCASPQGLVLEGDSVHVVCRGGQLVSFDQELAETRRVWLDDDLRDVVAWPGGLAVSRLRTAEVLLLDFEAKVLQRLLPAALPGLKPGVAWKMRAIEGGRIAMGHQFLDQGTVQLGPSAYSRSSTGCGPLSESAVTILDPSTSLREGATATVYQAQLTQGGGTMDFAAQGQELTFAFPGNALRPREDEELSPDGFAGDTSRGYAVQVLDWSLEVAGACTSQVTPSVTYGTSFDEVPIAAASLHSDTLTDTLVQTLEPATLKLVRSQKTITLHDEPRVDSGLRLFQMNVGTGLACVNCHPLGRSDGHTWDLAQAGPRRTQPLEGGVSDRGAFHWDAEFSTLDELIDDVLVVRMGFKRTLPQDHKDALKNFLDSIPQPKMDRNGDPEAVARGRALFESDQTECSICHFGPALTDNKIYNVGTGGNFVTPSLLGLAERLPIMHDGCARTLEERFGICGGEDNRHGWTAQLTPAEISDLVSYLGSL